MKWSKKALLLKIESSYGVDPTPTGAANAQLIQASDVELGPVVGEYDPRELVRAAGEYGSYAEFMTGKRATLSFSVEMAGSGTADLPTKYGPALRACALAEAITGATKVAYTPVSAAFESVAIYMHMDGHLHKLLGVYGDVEWIWSINKRPTLRFTVLGLFSAVTDVAFPTPDYTGFKAPLMVTDVNTPTLTLHGYAAKVASLSVKLGNQVEYRELVNSTTIEITDRKTTGTITLENVSVATKDWYGLVTAETLGALQVIHGAAAGYITQLDAPKVQLKNPRVSGNQDKSMLTLDLVLTPNAGNDEVVYTTK